MAIADLQIRNSFVGRARELAELRKAVDELRTDRTRLFLVSGEPGIGKTRLAEEIAGVASGSDARVVWGRCWEGGGAPAYWPWIQILRGLVVESGPPGAETLFDIPSEIAQLIPEIQVGNGRRPTKDPQEARFRLFDATAATLRAL